MNEHEEKSEHGLHRFQLHYEEIKHKSAKRLSVVAIAFTLPALGFSVLQTIDYLSRLS